MEPPSPRGPWSQDALNARKKRVSCDQSYPAQIWGDAYPSDEEIADDSGPGERYYVDYADDDDSSSVLRLPKQKCTMPSKGLTITFETPYLPALDAISSHHPLRLSMTHVS